MTKTDRHRTALACVAGWQPRWRVLSLEMLSTCTCYSWLHWRWFGYVSPSYCTKWPSLVLARFSFLLDHVSGPYCSTVSFPLAHVSCCGWVMCHFFIGPCVVFLLVTWRDHNTPRVFLLLDHVSRCYTSACQYFIQPHVMP